MLGLGLKYATILYLSSKLLNPTEFGMFSLFLIMLNFVYLFIGFGIIDTGMFLISKDNNKELTGATLILTLIICIFFTLILMLALYYYGFEHYRLISILSIGYLLNLFVKRISIGLHEKFTMYYFEFFMYLLTFLLILFFANSISSTIILYSMSMLIVSIFFLVTLKLKLSNLGENILLLIKHIKSYGLKVHLSQIVAMGTYDFDKLMLKYIYGFASVGVYNLALTFIMPVKLFSDSISEIMFKDFAKQKKIKKEVFLLNLGVSLFFSLILTLIGYSLIYYFYEATYHEILSYIYLLPILAILSSIYVPINNFFSAKGLGKLKLINALVLAVFNIIFNFIFIPNYGVFGAILATIAALTINNIMFIYQYKKYINLNHS